MKKLTKLFTILLTAVVLLSACQLFLGPDPDDSPMGIFDTLWNDFDRTYALFEHKNINWKGIYNEYSPLIKQNMSKAELSSVCKAMLSRLMDDHVWINTPHDFIVDPRWPLTEYGINDEFDFNIISDYHVDFISIEQYDGLSYGTFKSNPKIGYLRIPTFMGTVGMFMETGDWAKKIDSVLRSLRDTDGLVLDIRNNNGGFPSNLEYIANRFASKKANYMSVSTKTGPGRNDFSTPLYRVISPAGTRYNKPVVLLTNGYTISCAEMFTLALRTQAHVTHVGTHTQGALSVRIIRPLINGWDYSVSVQRALDMDGNSWERKSLTEAGIPPEQVIPAGVIRDWENSIFADEQLDGALQVLLGKIIP